MYRLLQGPTSRLTSGGGEEGEGGGEGDGGSLWSSLIVGCIQSHSLCSGYCILLSTSLPILSNSVASPPPGWPGGLCAGNRLSAIVACVDTEKQTHSQCVYVCVCQSVCIPPKIYSKFPLHSHCFSTLVRPVFTTIC